MHALKSIWLWGSALKNCCGYDGFVPGRHHSVLASEFLALSCSKSPFARARGFHSRAPSSHRATFRKFNCRTFLHMVQLQKPLNLIYTGRSNVGNLKTLHERACAASNGQRSRRAPRRVRITAVICMLKHQWIGSSF